MTWQEWAVPDPAPGEVRLRHTAIGVNFADTYHRGGVPHPWPVQPCPVVVGFEGAGFVEGVCEVTGGEGAAVVYEAIGRDTLKQSLDSLRPMGVCAAYGHVSGPPEPVDIIRELGARGSLFITRPAIMHYVAKRSDLVRTAQALFKAIGDGILDANVNYEYALKDAVKAHEALESGTTLGSTVLIP